jgi:hypothetical protein
MWLNSPKVPQKWEQKVPICRTSFGSNILNHLTPPQIERAGNGTGTGASVRLSGTTHREFLYW